jgi:predicted metal-binding protein
MTAYTLPATFALDWFNRCLETLSDEEREAKVVRPQSAKGSTVVLDLTDAEAADLLADAKHYADTSDDYWDEGLRPLCRSAARVVARLTK